MPGNVNNENILTAANQIVQAINDLVQELRDVQITINNQTGSGGGCCCCDDGEDLGGSTIQNDGGEEPYYGSEPPAEEEDRTGDPPDGFDSWDEYDQNKCNVAAAIVSGLAIWFRRFSQIQDVAFVTSGIVVGLAAGTVLAFPPAVIGLIVGVMVLLYVESQALEGLADDIETNKDELQCGIYSALSSTAAIDFLRSKLDVFIDNRFPAAVAWAAKKMVTLVITVDTMNKAFVDKIGQNLPTADCSTCCSHVFDYGNLVSDDSTTIVMDSLYQDGERRVSCGFNGGRANKCGPAVTITNFTVTGGPLSSPSTVPIYRIYSDTWTSGTPDLWNSNTEPTGTLNNVRKIHVASSSGNDYTVQFDYQEEI